LKKKIFHAHQEEICGHAIEKLEKKVNAFLEEHPGATVEWLQSSGGAGAGSTTGGVSITQFTDITAIISY